MGGLEDDQESGKAWRDTTWLRDWLSRQWNFSAQPHWQLAEVLRKTGYVDEANEMAYNAKEFERANASTSLMTWLGLTAQSLSVGYGYKPYRSVLLVIFFVGLGAYVFSRAPEGRAQGIRYGFVYSFDMLLPLVKLREKHYDIDIVGKARYYLYFHKIMGFVLAGFIVAGLSGITKTPLS